MLFYTDFDTDCILEALLLPPGTRDKYLLALHVG